MSRSSYPQKPGRGPLQRNLRRGLWLLLRPLEAEDAPPVLLERAIPERRLIVDPDDQHRLIRLVQAFERRQ